MSRFRHVVLKNFFSSKTTKVECAFDLPVEGVEMPSDHSAKGIYCNLDGRCIGLFVSGERLFLYLDGLAGEVCGTRVTAAHCQNGLLRQLDVTIDGSMTTVVYNNPRVPVSTQFYSEDEEDADFGLWLANVINSDARRSIILQSWRVG
jgi:hypothetical protein